VAKTKNEKQLSIWELMGKDAISYTVLHPSDLPLPSLTLILLSLYFQCISYYSQGLDPLNIFFKKLNNNLEKIRKILLILVSKEEIWQMRMFS